MPQGLAHESKICVNPSGSLTMGSWPVAISMTREPGSQRPSQYRGSVTRGRMASMVARVGFVQLTNMRGTEATRSMEKSSGSV